MVLSKLFNTSCTDLWLSAHDTLLLIIKVPNFAPPFAGEEVENVFHAVKPVGAYIIMEKNNFSSVPNKDWSFKKNAGWLGFSAAVFIAGTWLILKSKSSLKKDEITTKGNQDRKTEEVKGDQDRKTEEVKGDQERKTVQAKADAKCQVINVQLEADLKKIKARGAARQIASDVKTVNPETFDFSQEVKITNESLAAASELVRQPLIAGFIVPGELNQLHGLEGSKKSMFAMYLSILHSQSGHDAYSAYYDTEVRCKVYHERYSKYGFKFPENHDIFDAATTCPDLESFLAHLWKRTEEALKKGRMTILVVLDSASYESYGLDTKKGAKLFLHEYGKLSTEMKKQGATVSLLLLSHTKQKTEGNMRDADVYKLITRRAIVTYKVEALTENSLLLFMEKDNTHTVPRQTVMLLSHKGYLHPEKAYHKSIMLLNRDERKAMMSKLASDFHLKKVEIATLMGLDKSNISRGLKKGKNRLHKSKKDTINQIVTEKSKRNDNRNNCATPVQLLRNDGDNLQIRTT